MSIKIQSTYINEPSTSNANQLNSHGARGTGNQKGSGGQVPVEMVQQLGQLLRILPDGIGNAHPTGDAGQGQRGIGRCGHGPAAGCGVAPEQVERRAVELIVQGHSGRLEVNSAPGEFTEFIITLPYEQ